MIEYKVTNEFNELRNIIIKTMSIIELEELEKSHKNFKGFSPVEVNKLRNYLHIQKMFIKK